ncbi:cell division initiation protein [Hydrogenispora ethanolica]|uniref:Cell division initiation protein n=2 Tax=Hydrogenispora ethanolica TaxID=1082276 RepID=A0A4R1RU71_HYDET|nr:cell division initiation protein [Hydrogenispora ethanolica]
MMLTPVELETVIFRRGMRGYKVREVQSFMSQISTDYEFLYRENNELKAKLDEVQTKLEQYVQKEETLRNALVLAQETAEEQIGSAKLKADIIVKEAQFQAEQMKGRVKDDIQLEIQKLTWLKSQVDLFKCQFKSFLNTLLTTAEQELDLNIVWEHLQRNPYQKSGVEPAVKEAAATAEEAPETGVPQSSNQS